MSLPDKLRAAREANGWTVEEVGARLRLPARVIERVESGDYQALGAPIYRRGYLRSFARLVGVDESEVEASLREQLDDDPVLVATGVMPRGEYVTERYLRPATYIALTALIAVPLVWWTASGRLADELANSRSFELRQQPVPATSLPELPELLRDPATPDRSMVRASLLTPPPEQVTVVPRTDPQVSVAETSAINADDTDPSDPGTEAAAASGSSEVLGAGRHLIMLELAGDSWVQILDANGRTVQQAMLTPGQWHYRSDGRMSFTIGNSTGARLTLDGDPVDLADHRSPNNVARVDLLAGDG